MVKMSAYVARLNFFIPFDSTVTLLEIHPNKVSRQMQTYIYISVVYNTERLEPSNMKHINHDA